MVSTMPRTTGVDAPGSRSGGATPARPAGPASPGDAFGAALDAAAGAGAGVGRHRGGSPASRGDVVSSRGDVRGSGVGVGVGVGVDGGSNVGGAAPQEDSVPSQDETRQSESGSPSPGPDSADPGPAAVGGAGVGPDTTVPDTARSAFGDVLLGLDGRGAALAAALPAGTAPTAGAGPTASTGATAGVGIDVTAVGVPLSVGDSTSGASHAVDVRPGSGAPLAADPVAEPAAATVPPQPRGALDSAGLVDAASATGALSAATPSGAVGDAGAAARPGAATAVVAATAATLAGAPTAPADPGSAASDPAPSLPGTSSTRAEVSSAAPGTSSAGPAGDAAGRGGTPASTTAGTPGGAGAATAAAPGARAAGSAGDAAAPGRDGADVTGLPGVVAPPAVAGTGPSGATAPTAAPTAPPQPQSLAPQLARPLFTLAHAGTGEHVVTVTVTPESLGPVTVRAVVGHHGVHVDLYAPTDVGREAVRAVLGDLRRDLGAASGAGVPTSLDLSSQDAPPRDPSGTAGGPGRDGADRGGTLRDGDRVARPSRVAPDGTAAPDLLPASGRGSSTTSLDVLA